MQRSLPRIFKVCCQCLTHSLAHSLYTHVFRSTIHTHTLYIHSLYTHSLYTVSLTIYLLPIHSLPLSLPIHSLIIYSLPSFSIHSLPTHSHTINSLPPSLSAAGKPLTRVTTKVLYDEYGLDDNTRAFTGHAMALHTDDDYINEVRTYCHSLSQSVSTAVW